MSGRTSLLRDLRLGPRSSRRSRALRSSLLRVGEYAIVLWQVVVLFFVLWILRSCSIAQLLNCSALEGHSFALLGLDRL
jgi:hypothetical protein